VLGHDVAGRAVTGVGGGAVLDRLGSAASAEEAVGLFHHHGTGEAFDAPARGGPFDGLLWLADSPAVAQTYIPAAGIESLMVVPAFRLGERVRPDRHSGWYAAVRQMGFESPEVEWGSNGTARSWAIPEGYPTYAEVCEWIQGVLGYADENGSRPGRDRFYRIRAALDRDGRTVLLPADRLYPGRLFLVEGVADLRLLDMATGRGGDLTDPDHLKQAWFRGARDRGYDGIVINDFCQSRAHGNVGHRSWGCRPRGWPR